MAIKTMGVLPVTQLRAGLSGRLRLGLGAFLLAEDADHAFRQIKQFETEHGHGAVTDVIKYQHWRSDRVLKIFFNVQESNDSLLFAPPAIPDLTSWILPKPLPAVCIQLATLLFPQLIILSPIRHQ